MLENTVGIFSGYLQIHQDGYQDNPTLDNSFEISDSLMNIVRSKPAVSSVVPRIDSYALAATQHQSRPAMIMGIDVEAEIAEVAAHRKKFLDETMGSLQSVEAEAKRFARSVLDMKRYVTGLSSTRMMCKIESAALSNSGTALVGIVEQLDACQDEIEERLARMVELNSVIQSNTAMLRSML